MEQKALKILVSGDVNGEFDKLIKRVNNVNKKSGPFDMLFCVGEFVGPDKEANEKIMHSNMEMPIPTYILGPCSPSTSQSYPEDPSEFSNNLIFLGKRGILNTTGGLKVAYLSGVEGSEGNAYQMKKFQFDASDVDDFLVSVKASTGFLGLDLLVTSIWPAEVAKFSSNVPSKEITGSRLISRLATGLKPRYHFAGMGIHYERTPYRNHRVLLEAAQHVTRFIGLAPVGNPSKEKWLYAFSTVPMQKMSRSELTAQPANATEFPYMELIARMILDLKDYSFRTKEKEKQNAPMEKQYFYDMSDEVEDRVDHGGKRRRKDESSSRQLREQEPCWFCLSNIGVEQYLVVSVADECYMAMPKGPLTEDHLMILTVGHIQSVVGASEEVRQEIKKYKDALTLMFNKQEKVLVCFERNYKTRHLQIQVVPVPKVSARTLRSTFLNVAREKGVNLSTLKDVEEIWDIVNEGCPYFHAELPDGTRLYTTKMNDFPIQFGREVLSNAAILDCEEKIDWRNCELEKAVQTKMVEKLQADFKAFDFTDNDSD